MLPATLAYHLDFLEGYSLNVPLFREGSVTVGPDGTDASSNSSKDAILRVEQTGELSVDIQDQGDGQ